MDTRRHLLFALICSLAAMFFLPRQGSGQVVTTTFSATLNGVPVPIDSVWVKNVTAGGDTMLYTPDTVLVLGVNTGMNEVLFGSGSAGVNMGPAVPNPFDGTTRFEVNVEDAGDLFLTVFDAVGKVLVSTRRDVRRGAHMFSYAGGPQGVLFVEARWNGQRAVQRLMNMSSGQQVSLHYGGWNDPQDAGRQKDGWFTWQLGDSLFYIVYATSPHGYIFSAASSETVTGPSTPVVELLPGMVCADDPIVVDIDGNVYPVVQIGNQCWMAEDLRTGHYRNGAVINHVPYNNEGIIVWSHLTTGAWCSDQTTQSKVYNWYTVINHNNICPLGWRVPTNDDWAQLADHLGPRAGDKMKAISTWWSLPDTGVTNESGFSGLPRGGRDYNGYFQGAGSLASWWSSSSDGNNSAWRSALVQFSDRLIRNSTSKVNGFCVRCIRGMQPAGQNDCSGVLDGTAYIDNCGICVGGTADLLPCTRDCAGVWGGTASIDANCGICVGGTTGRRPCVQDCVGVWGGTARIDGCGTCAGGTTGVIPCVQDCEGVWGGSALRGMPCDDGHPDTSGDIYGNDCVCAGCPTSVTDIDGNVYPVVRIGDQCWVAENLRTTRYHDGIAIPNVTDGAAWRNLTTGAMCSYGNAQANVATYGRIYNWYAVASPGICPEGWHVPTDAEWKVLERSLGMPWSNLDYTGRERGVAENVGGKMKALTLWNSPNTGATGESGFAGLPGGYRAVFASSVNFSYLDFAGYWWSASPSGEGKAWYRGLDHFGAWVNRGDARKAQGHCIRCMRSPNDCAGVPLGSAYLDNCGTCVEGTTGNVACTQDCAGTWGGTALSGTPCNDNDSRTTNDRYGTDCICVGESIGCEETVTDIDGNVYGVVQIGDQCWMTENLRTSHYRDGSVIPNVTGDTDWRNLSTPAWCNVRNDADNDTVYGKLYNWYAAVDPEICPLGWHVPTDAEWQALEATLGMSASELNTIGNRGFAQNVGGKMKARGSAQMGTGLWWAPNSYATNESGFSGLPGGYRDVNGTFSGSYESGVWWSASMYEEGYAWRRSLSNGSLLGAASTRSIYDARYGSCIRCLRDQ